MSPYRHEQTEARKWFDSTKEELEKTFSERS